VKIAAFDCFVGIDWSGAKECSGGSIQIAKICCGDSCPETVSPRAFGKSYWTRSAVLDYVKSLDSGRTLIGFDFAFSLPWPGGNGLLLASGEKLHDVRSLWERVERLCADEDDLFAGPVWLSERSPFRPFIYHHHSKHKGSLYCRKRFRITEKAASGRPISVYHMTGAQVGQGSFAGMRLLHALRDSYGDVAIWPFHQTGKSRVVIVEVYPSLFYRQAGCRRPRNKDTNKDFLGNIRKTLNHFGIPDSRQKFERSIDAADATVAAAALACLSNDKAVFSISSIHRKMASREGWIFGVPSRGVT
jgi:hypothetical protein